MRSIAAPGFPEATLARARADDVVRQTLLATAFASSLLYVVTTVAGAFQFPGYDWVSQTISELSAIDAPSRMIVVMLMTVYGVLALTLGTAAHAAARHRAGRLAGGSLALYGFVCLLAPLAPMHLRAAQPTLTDAMHIVLTIVTAALITLAVAAGAFSFGRRFRNYSFATLAVFLLFGALTGIQAQNIAANRPTPFAGLFERICIFSFMVWIVVFAVATAGQPQAARAVLHDEVPDDEC
jgi:hypothetical protein